jgi:hypothetical protein
VFNEADQPLRRAHLTLRPMEAGISTIGSDADDKGTFSIQQIVPGRYMLVAERDGYLPSSTCLRGALRMPPVITIGAGAVDHESFISTATLGGNRWPHQVSRMASPR